MCGTMQSQGWPTAQGTSAALPQVGETSTNGKGQRDAKTGQLMSSRGNSAGSLQQLDPQGPG